MEQYLKLFTLFASLEISLGSVLPKAPACKISVNEHFSDPQPLLLYQNDATDDLNAFPLPFDDLGTLAFKKGETLNLVCPSGEVIVNKKSTRKEIVEIACVSDINFEVEKKISPFTAFTCSRIPAHVARYTNRKCAKKYKEIEIGFEIEGRFITHIISCFDEKLQNVIYTKSTVSSRIAGSQVNFPRPAFQAGDFYNVSPYSVNSLYSRNGQKETINKILGLDKDDESVIQMDSNYYLATGHLTPKTDFVFGAQQRLTFYYVNAAPQWQTFNAGNWFIMETNCRSLAYERGIDLTIYTGTYGIATLEDVNGVEQELYLWKSGKNKGIPVPAIFYKIVYDAESKAGIALIGINNPYKKDLEDDIICKDVCSKVSWLTWDSKDNSRGYAYCCDVNDFRKTIKVLPKFTVKKLLV